MGEVHPEKINCPIYFAVEEGTMVVGGKNATASL